jgi:SAM-dependent methyltransferase
VAGFEVTLPGRFWVTTHTISPGEDYDAVICLFSSFGYLESDDEHEKVLSAIAGALKPGGQVLLDVRNRDRIIRNYRDKTWEEFRDGTAILCSTKFDPITGRNSEGYKRIRKDGTSHLTQASVRLFTVPERAGMLRRAGFNVQGVFGDCDASSFGFESKRCLIVASKGMSTFTPS